MITKLKIFIAKMLHSLKELITPKIKIEQPTVIIDKSYWDPNWLSLANSRYSIKAVDKFQRIKRSSYDNIIAYIGRVPKKELKNLHNLSWLQITSHGFNGYDNLALYANKEVTVTNFHNIYSDAMARFCIAMWYGYNCYSTRKFMSKKIDIKNTHSNEKISVIIYGLGDIGCEIAKKCKNQSWNVTGVKRSLVNNCPEYVDEVMSFEDSLKVLSNYDYVINVLPETNETKNIYNYSFFKSMKKTALFCNIGRGSSVVDSDLEKAVLNGEIRGAILDACNNYKYNHPNIILTGHSSSVSYDNAAKINQLFSSQLKTFLEGDLSQLLYQIKLKNGD